MFNIGDLVRVINYPDPEQTDLVGKEGSVLYPNDPAKYVTVNIDNRAWLFEPEELEKL